MLLRAMCAAGFALVAAGKAAACGGSIGIATDNVLRGVSLGDGRPAWLFDAHCEPATGWVAGLAASRVHLVGRDPDVQWSAYLDRRWQLGEDWSAKVGVVHYDAFRRPAADGLRYDELNAAIGFRGRWRASLAVSPNATDLYFRGALPPAGLAVRRYRTVWVENTLHQPIGTSRFAADAGIGMAFPDGEGNSRYHYASVGLRWQATDDVFVYATRIWTGAIRWRFNLLGQTYTMTLPPRQAWVGTLLWSF